MDSKSSLHMVSLSWRKKKSFILLFEDEGPKVLIVYKSKWFISQNGINEVLNSF